MMKELFTMCFIAVTVSGKCVQGDQGAVCLTFAMRLSTGMKENAVINLFQKIRYRKSLVQN